MSKRVSRRQAIILVAAGGMANAASRRRGAPAFLADPAPNSQLATAVIGCANQGVEK